MTCSVFFPGWWNPPAYSRIYCEIQRALLPWFCVGGVLWCHAELVKVLSKAWNGRNRRRRDRNQAPRASPASLREREHGVVPVPDQYLRRR